MLITLLLALASLNVVQVNGSFVFLINGTTWIGEPIGNGSYVLMSINSTNEVIALLHNDSLHVIYDIQLIRGNPSLIAPLEFPANQSNNVIAVTNASINTYLRLFTVDNLSDGELIGPSRNITYLGYPPYTIQLGSGTNCTLKGISIIFLTHPSLIPIPVYVNTGPNVEYITGNVTIDSIKPNVPIKVLGPDYVIEPLGSISSVTYTIQVCVPRNNSFASINYIIRNIRFSGTYRYATSVPYNDPITGVPLYKIGWCSDYAYYAANMLRKQGINARVAVGYIIGSDGKVTGMDYHAWLEASMMNNGWIDIEITPPELTPTGSSSIWNPIDALIGLIISVPALIALLLAMVERKYSLTSSP